MTVDLKSSNHAIKGWNKEEHNVDKEDQEEKEEKEVKGKKIVNQGKRGSSKKNEKSKSSTKETTTCNAKEVEEWKKNPEKSSIDSATSMHFNESPQAKMVNTGSADFSDFGKNKDKVAFVDKTLLIKEVGETLAGGQSLLVTRPRRSGKSLTLSMLSWYYSILTQKEHDSIFEGTMINDYTRFKEENANKYPVVFLDFKEFESRASAPDGWPYNQFFIQLNKSMKDYQDDISSSTTLNKLLKDEFIQLTDKKYQESLAAPYSDVNQGLMKLLEILKKHYGKKCVVLIDEYDAPYNIILSQKTNVKEDMDLFKDAYKNFLQSALKASQRSSVHFCVMTGVLKVKHDQLLSGLNNLAYDQLFSETSSTLTSNYFGFTEHEVKRFVEGASGKQVSDITMDNMHQFYNGYRILHFKDSYYGKIMHLYYPSYYNPWSIANYVKLKQLCAYWTYTTTDTLLRACYELLSNLEKSELSFLLENDLPVQKRISDTVFLGDLRKNSDIIWSVLLHTGYLTFCEGTQPVGNTELYNLKIPNEDVKKAFRDTIYRFKTLIPRNLTEEIYNCFERDDISKLFDRLNGWIKGDNDTRHTCTSEEPYHMFLYQTLRLALQSETLDKGYTVHSERIQTQTCNRFDVAVVSKTKIYMFELNLAIDQHSDTLENKLQQALNQIDEKDYPRYLKEKNLPTIKIGVVGQNRTLYHRISNE